jgi:hypothetical protein
LGVCFALGCVGDTKGGGDDGGDPDDGAFGTLETRAGFCTSVIDVPRFSIYCLGDDGSWEPFTRQGSPEEGDLCDSPQLAGAAGDGMLVTFERCGEGTEEIHVQRATSSGWEPLGAVVNADGSGGLLPLYSQFGASLIEFQDQIFATWTGWTTPFEAMLSRFDGSGWQRTTIASVGELLIRHPTFFDAGDALYVHWGEPNPTVWNVTGGTPEPVGSVPLLEGEWTLYTSLARWRGQLVLAYSSGPSGASWADSVLTTKVAFQDGTGFQVDPAPVEDTPGHDGMVPFLFTIGDELYIMVADYTTEGLPDEVGSPFRFRVKRWTGEAWERVGDESPAIANSQRLEYLLDGDTVLVGVLRVLPGAPPVLQRIVLGWRGGVFGRVGEPLPGSSAWQPRPGALVAPP